MDASTLGQWVILMFAPTLVICAALALPRGISALRRLTTKRRAGATPQPTRPPIEQLAADVRRLLQRHHALRQSTEMAMRGLKLRATEAAITDLALEAARALGVPCPSPANGTGLTTAELVRLLQELADAGLVLAPLVGQFADDDHS
jgi:hypothetical protein